MHRLVQAYDAIDHSLFAGKDYCGCMTCEASPDVPCKGSDGGLCEWTATNGAKCKSSCGNGNVQQALVVSASGDSTGWSCSTLQGAQLDEEQEEALDVNTANTLFMGVDGAV